MKPNNKQRLFEIMQKVDNTFLTETKAFSELRKLNKKLYDETIKLEAEIGKDILDLIDKSINKINYKTNKEKDLVYQIILDLILDRYLKSIE